MNTKTAEEQIKDFLKKEEWREGDTDTFDYNGLIEFLGKFAAQSAPLATEGVAVPNDFLDYIKDERLKFCKAINDQEWDTELRTAAENFVLAYNQMMDRLQAANTIPSQLEGNALKQEGEQWVHLHERLKNQEQTINDFQRGIENLFGLKQNTIAFFGDLQRHPSQPLGGYTLQQVGDFMSVLIENKNAKITAKEMNMPPDEIFETDSIYDAFINEYNDLIEIYKSTLAPPPNPTITNAPK